MPKKAGFVAIVGRPNVGKSTLLNLLIGEKIAGVSPKPQTTRGTVRGILSRQEGQAVFLDTPGLHRPKDKLGSWMIREIDRSFEGADLVYWLVLPGRIHPDDRLILEKIQERGLPCFLLVNQVDRYPKPDILPVMEHYAHAHTFKELIPVSARTGLQTDLLIEKTFDHLPEGEQLFPEDQISDQQERFIVAEILREQIYHLTRQEVPYASAVVIDKYEERKDGLVEIFATVVVERDTQKAILIGRGGQMMKEIGQKARLGIESFLGRRVFLKVWVKILGRWKEDANMLRQLGYG